MQLREAVRFCRAIGRLPEVLTWRASGCPLKALPAQQLRPCPRGCATVRPCHNHQQSAIKVNNIFMVQSDVSKVGGKLYVLISWWVFVWRWRSDHSQHRCNAAEDRGNVGHYEIILKCTRITHDSRNIGCLSYNCLLDKYLVALIMNKTPNYWKIRLQVSLYVALLLSKTPWNRFWYICD